MHSPRTPAAYRAQQCSFGLQRHAFIALISEALPQVRAKAPEFWLTFVREGIDEVIFPLEVFAWLAVQKTHGLTRCIEIYTLFISGIGYE